MAPAAVGASAPVNVIQLSASATREVAQDYMEINLAATRDGTDAGTVQSQLKSALETALAQAKAVASAGQVEVRTGSFSLQPRYEDRTGKISGWRGRTELLIQGRDFAQLGALAGRISTMVVENVSFSLSREGRAAVEQQVQSEAVASFKTKAGQLAHDFGFANYSLRELAVSGEDNNRPMMAVRLSSKAMAADSALPVEAGKTEVTVGVSGTVQLR